MTPPPTSSSSDAWGDLGGQQRHAPSCPGCGERDRVERQNMVPVNIGEWFCARCVTVFHGDEAEWRMNAEKRKCFRARTQAAHEAREAQRRAITGDTDTDDGGESSVPRLRGGDTPVSSARNLLHTRRLLA